MTALKVAVGAAFSAFLLVAAAILVVAGSLLWLAWRNDSIGLYKEDHPRFDCSGPLSSGAATRACK